MIERAVRAATQGTCTQVSFHFEDDLPTVEADEGQIVQVLHNLALNAVQAMPGGGSLQISGLVGVAGGSGGGRGRRHDRRGRTWRSSCATAARASRRNT